MKAYLLGSLVLTGCSDGGSGKGGDDSDSTAPPGEKLTYWKDVKELIDASCLECHSEGGIGPFPLATYDDVYTVRELVKSVVPSRTMPPWFASKDCGAEFANDGSYTDEEIALIVAWIEQGALEGDEDDFDPAKVPPPDPDLDRVDVEIEMAQPFWPTVPQDEVRCFNLEWPIEAATYITAINFRLGSPDIMHHVTLHKATQPEEITSFLEREKEDPEPGYACEENVSDQATEVLAGWLGGTWKTEFPEGSGVLMPPGAMIQFQAHYTISPAEVGVVSDRSGVEFMVDPEAEPTDLILVFDKELPGGETIIAEGDPSTTHEAYVTPHTAPDAFYIHGVNFHMHALGVGGSISILRADGSEDCLLELTGWNADWQQAYSLASPVPFYKGDQFHISCTWDNSQENQPYEDGVQRETKDVKWGESLTDEMCQGSIRIVGMPDEE